MLSFATVMRCPSCRASLMVKSRRLEGKQSSCPRCEEAFVVEYNRKKQRFCGVLFLPAVGDCNDTLPFDGGRVLINAEGPPANKEARPARPSRQHLPASAANTIRYQRQAGGLSRAYSTAGSAVRGQRTAGPRRPRWRLTRAAAEAISR